MFGKRIAALGLAAAISACTCIAASAEENKVELIVASFDDVWGINIVDTGLFDIDGALVKAEVIDSEIITTVVAEDASTYEGAEADRINADITDGCDTSGYEFTLNLYDDKGNVTKTIPVDSDHDTASTLATYKNESGYEFEVYKRTAMLYDINDKYAVLTVSLYEDDMFFSAGYDQIINFETNEITEINVSEITSDFPVLNEVVMDGLYAAEFVSDDLVALKVGSSTTYGRCTAVLLFDVNTGKAVGEPYGELTPDDSGAHRVSFLEESYDVDMVWGTTFSMGYVDNDGNVLAEYAKGDEGEIWYPCSSFDGDYAAVTKNGEVYLIDRNMNIVSNTFNCDVVTIENAGDGLYLITASEGEFKGYDYYIISYAENSEAASDTSDEDATTDTPNESTGDNTGDDTTNTDNTTTGGDTTGSDEGADENSTSDTNNADSTDGADDENKTSAETGAAGIAGAAALAVTAIGAVVLSRRKK